MGAEQVGHAVAHEDALQLGEDAFLGDVVQQMFAPVQRLGGLFLDGEPVPCPKAQRPQNAQTVLPEPLLGHAHAADEAALQILLPAEPVHHAGVRVVGHGVDGEIPPGQVLLDIAHKAHRIRVPVVAVAALRPEGGDLVPLSFPTQEHRAVLDAGLVHVVRREAGDDLLGQGGRADVPVVRLPPQQGVPDAAAYHVGFVAGSVQLSQNLRHRGRQTDGGQVSGHCHGCLPR